MCGWQPPRAAYSITDVDNTPHFRCPVKFRRATLSELPQIVALLADDDIGRTREATTTGDALAPYLAAWTAMEAEPSNWILVAVAEDDEVLGVLQLTLIAGLSRQGTKRAQIEGVRVKSTARGASVGRQLMAFAIETAKQHGCGLVQLTTDKRRADARRFYESLGFEATHVGMKIVW